MTTLARPCAMAGTPTTEAAQQGVTLGGDVFMSKTIEVDTASSDRMGRLCFGALLLGQHH